MAEQKIVIPVSAVAAYATVLTTDLLIKLGHPPAVATVRAFKKATTAAILSGVLEAAPEDYRNQIELLKAHEIAQRLIGEQKDKGHAETEIS